MEPRPYLVAVECPRSELHVAALLVEREVLDVDGAGTLVDRHHHRHHQGHDDVARWSVAELL